MRKIDEAKLNKILSNHKLWLTNKPNGIRADLKGINLKGVNLSGADLKYANLYGADLYGADLYGADLYGANLGCTDLRDADLRSADLKGAYLKGANLSGADLRSADLRSANLWDADLRCANLEGANLGCTDLRDADLKDANLRDVNFGCADFSGADLKGADLRNADFRDANLSCVKNIFFPIACPEKGSFIAFKKAGCYIIELFIPSNAKRCSATSRKCRCSKAKVISITTLSGDKTNITEVHSNYDPNFIYKLGEYVEVKNFDDNRWNECSTGIYFFITRQEAVNY